MNSRDSDLKHFGKASSPNLLAFLSRLELLSWLHRQHLCMREWRVQKCPFSNQLTDCAFKKKQEVAINSEYGCLILPLLLRKLLLQKCQ